VQHTAQYLGARLGLGQAGEGGVAGLPRAVAVAGGGHAEEGADAHHAARLVALGRGTHLREREIYFKIPTFLCEDTPAWNFLYSCILEKKRPMGGGRGGGWLEGQKKRYGYQPPADSSCQGLRAEPSFSSWFGQKLYELQISNDFRNLHWRPNCSGKLNMIG